MTQIQGWGDTEGGKDRRVQVIFKAHPSEDWYVFSRVRRTVEDDIMGKGLRHVYRAICRES